VKIYHVIAATLLIFASDMVTGGLFVRHLRESDAGTAKEASRESRIVTPIVSSFPERQPIAIQESSTSPRPPLMGRMSANLSRSRLQFIEKATAELELSEIQQGRIRQLLIESHRRMLELSRSIAPNVRDEIRNTHQAIMAELNQQQRLEFHRLTVERFQSIRPPRPSAKPDASLDSQL